MKQFLNKLLSKLFPLKDLANVTPRQRAIVLEVMRVKDNQGVKR